MKGRRQKTGAIRDIAQGKDAKLSNLWAVAAVLGLEVEMVGLRNVALNANGSESVPGTFFAAKVWPLVLSSFRDQCCPAWPSCRRNDRSLQE